MAAEFVEEGVIDAVVVGDDLLGVAEGDLLFVREVGVFVVGDLGDLLFREELSPLQGLAQAASVHAAVAVSDLEADQLLQFGTEAAGEAQGPIEGIEGLGEVRGLAVGAHE